MSNEDDLKTKCQLTPAEEIDLGKEYPVVGMITKVLDENEKTIILEVNYNIELHIHTENQKSKELLKAKAFDVGIFLVTFNRKFSGELVEGEYPYKGVCDVVMFNTDVDNDRAH